MEEYDPAKDEWRLVAPMNVNRSRVALCANMGKLWAIGGYDGESNLSTVCSTFRNLLRNVHISVFIVWGIVVFFRLKYMIQKLMNGPLLQQCVLMAVESVLELFQFHNKFDKQH